MSFLSLVRPSLYLICFNDSFDKDLLSVQLLLRQLINEYHSPLLNMAFVVKNMILALALAFFALVNLSVAGALPSVGGLEIDMTNSLVARNTSMEAGCPAGQSPVQAGCSTCTECCIFELNDAGCGQHSVEELAINDYNCHPLFIGMNNVWITECTGSFAECMLYSNPDCTGDGSWGITNEKDYCHHTQYWIKSIQCYEDAGPDRRR